MFADHVQGFIQDFPFRGGDKHLLKRGVCDEKEGSGRQIPMSINMPQLIFRRAESAHHK